MHRLLTELIMKLFTIEEANSLLPSVRPIVKSIQRSHRRLGSFQKTASWPPRLLKTGAAECKKGRNMRGY